MIAMKHIKARAKKDTLTCTYGHPLINPCLVVVEKSEVRNDPTLSDDCGEVPKAKWRGWQFDSRLEIFSLLDGKTKSPPTAR
jgi:hypothetical protein